MKIEHNIEEWDAHKNIVFYAITDEGSAAGRVILELTDEALTISSLYVYDDCRNKGIGTKLLQSVLDFYKNNTYEFDLMLKVRNDNEIAIKLYKKFGFVLSFKSGNYDWMRLKDK